MTLKQESRKPEASSMNPRQVEAYLARHPDFFVTRTTLLEHLTVPHPSGDAVSLVSRQLDLLRARNRELQAQLDELVDIARTNDELFQKMHQLTLALFNAVSLEETLDSLRFQLHESFQADFVAARIIRHVSNEPVADTFIDPEHPDLSHFQKLFESSKPRCGHPTHSQAELLFGDEAKAVLSCAMIPMTHADMRGILAIGSRNKDRFHPRMGHLFLSQMGEVVGSHLDNLIRTQYSWLCEPMQSSS